MISTYYEVESEKLQHDYRIGVVADTHDIDNRGIINNLERNHPDFIVCLGDIVYGAVIRSQNFNRDKAWLSEFPNAINLFRELPQIAPTYFVYGNHEWLLSPHDDTVLHSMDVRILDNEWVKHEGLLLGGLTAADVTNYWRFKEKFYKSFPNYQEGNLERKYMAGDSHENRKAPDSAWIEDYEKQAGFRILLCHHPEYWAVQPPYLQKRRIDLVLAGHAHGGQIRIFGQGFYASGQGSFPKYTSGVHKGKYGEMIISRGLFNTSKIPRFFNPTEMVYVDLKGK